MLCMIRAGVRVTAMGATAAAAILLAAVALLPSRFATPETDEPRILVDRPVALPVPVRVAAPAGTGDKARSQECDGAAHDIVYPPEPVGSPQTWFTSDDYPWWALMRNKQGVTTVELVVDARGLVMGCGLAGSSGHMSLDGKTCSVFRERARFRPARDDRGCAVPSVWHKRVRWQISG